MNDEQSTKKDWQPSYGDGVFHVFDIEGLQIDQLWETSGKYCSDDGYSGEIAVAESEGQDDDSKSYHAVLRFASAQGVG